MNKQNYMHHASSNDISQANSNQPIKDTGGFFMGTYKARPLTNDKIIANCINQVASKGVTYYTTIS